MILQRVYGPVGPLAGDAPLDVLVCTILSQNTSDVNSNAAFLSLRHSFPEWDDVINAEPGQVAAVIRRGGLADVKAGRIAGTLAEIKRREGRLSLDALKKLSTSDALAYLTGLPGVGVKTACCVLLFAFGMPVMPVDTHVARVARRVGWVTPEMRTDKIHECLEQMIPERWILPLHLYVIRHGRRVCRARNPLCERCPISIGCPRRL